MKGTWPLTPTNLHFFAGGGKRSAQLLFFSNIKSTLNIVCFSKFFVCPYMMKINTYKINWIIVK